MDDYHNVSAPKMYVVCEETKGVSMSIRAIILSLCALIFVVGCGGNDGDSNGDTTGDPPATTQADSASTEPSEPATGAESSDGSVEILAVRGGRPNARADTTVRTTPNADCSLSYTTPDGDESDEPGLGPKTASGNGRVSWSWRISPDTTPGTGTVTVMCNDVTVEEPIIIE